MEVKGDPKKAFKYRLPVLLPLLFVGVLLLFLSYEDNSCREIFGVPITFLTFISATYLFPGAIFIVSIYQGYIGYKILRSKENPPPNTPVFFDTPVTFGLKDKLNALALIVLYPAFGIAALYFGNVIYTEIMAGKTLAEFRTENRSDCNLTHNTYEPSEVKRQ